MGNIIRKRENDGSERALSTTTAWEPFRMMRELLRWDPFQEMAPLAPRDFAFNPDFDVKETKDAFVFTADLPGIKQGELEIALTGNRLTIGGKREMERREEKDTYYTFERSYGAFTRSFTLPAGIDAEHVAADLKDGVLTVAVPKKAEAQPKKIEVKMTEKKS